MILLLIRHGESEANNGLLAGMPREEAAKKYPKVENLPADRSVYGQESRVEFRSRAERVLEKYGPVRTKKMRSPS